MKHTFKYYIGDDVYEYDGATDEVREAACDAVFYEYFYSSGCFDFSHLTYNRKNIASAICEYLSDVEGNHKNVLINIIDTFDCDYDPDDIEDIRHCLANQIFNTYFDQYLPDYKMSMTDFAYKMKMAIDDMLYDIDNLCDDTVDYFYDEVRDYLYDVAMDQYSR